MINDSAVPIIGSLTIDRADVLPDCRAHDHKGIVFRFGVAHIPIFCANCHVQGGLVPEAGVTFAFWLCTACVDTHGMTAGMMALPDEMFWQAVHQESIDMRGRLLSDAELVNIVESDTSPLATLLKQGHV